MNIIILQHIKIEDPGFIKDLMRPCIVVMNKYDLVDKSKKDEIIKIIEEKFNARSKLYENVDYSLKTDILIDTWALKNVPLDILDMYIYIFGQTLC